MAINLNQTVVRTLAGTASSLGTTFSSGASGGSTIIIVAALPSSANWFTNASDSGGNIYTFLASAILETGTGPFIPAGSVWVFYSPDVTAGWLTTQLDIGGGNNRACMIAREYSGLVAKPLSLTSFAQVQQGTKPFQSPPLTTPQPNTLAVGWLGMKSGATAFAASGGFVNYANTTNLGGQVECSFEHLVVTDPQSLTSYFTATGTINVAVGLTLLKGPYDDESFSLGSTGAG